MVEGFFFFFLYVCMLILVIKGKLSGLRLKEGINFLFLFFLKLIIAQPKADVRKYHPPSVEWSFVF